MSVSHSWAVLVEVAEVCVIISAGYLSESRLNLFEIQCGGAFSRSGRPCGILLLLPNPKLQHLSLIFFGGCPLPV